MRLSCPTTVNCPMAGGDLLFTRPPPRADPRHRYHLFLKRGPLRSYLEADRLRWCCGARISKVVYFVRWFDEPLAHCEGEGHWPEPTRSIVVTASKVGYGHQRPKALADTGDRLGSIVLKKSLKKIHE